MSNLKQDTAIANEPREEITDADLAVGLAMHGFHVYLDDTDRQLTFETVYNYLDDYGQLKDGHTFSVPMMEVAQYGALEALCEKFDSFNDVVRTNGGLYADSGLPGLSLEDYADELLDDGESEFVWRNGQSEWENVRRCILSGETKFLHNFLYDAAFDYPLRAADIREDLNDYETTYLKERQESMDNKQALYSIEQGGDCRYFFVPKGYTVENILKIANEKAPFAALMGLGEQIYGEDRYAAIQQSDKFTFSVEMNFDTDTAQIYEVNGGKGGISEEDRIADNIRFSEIKISEYIQDRTFAYDIGFTVVRLDISTQERKNTVSEALKNVINTFGEKNDMSLGYKSLLNKIEPKTEFICAFGDFLSNLKYALTIAESNKELCASMLDSIKSAESNPQKTVVIKGYNCLERDAWEEYGVKFTIGQSVDDTSFYYARATDGKITRDYEYDYKPDREKVISDHADKLAEEDIDRGEAIYGADGYLAFPDPELKHLVENIPQQRNISHKTTNDDLFEYNGYHFVPVGKLDSNVSLQEIAMATVSKNSLGMSVYNERRLPYSYSEFYIAAKGSKADIFRCIENGKSYLPGENELFEYTGKIISLTKEKQAEHIPQQRDISHKTTNADLPAKRGESRGKTMEQNTKFEVSTMSKLEGDGPAKAIGTLVVNGEFAVHGVRVVEGQNGLYAAMPYEKQSNGEYKDVVFPVTKDARAAIDNAVLDAYEKLAASPERTLKNEIAVPEKPVSKVYAQMHEVKSDKTQTKAAGQMTIDSCLVVTGVKLNEGTNTEGQTKTFVAMPSKPNENGTYDDVAHAITKDFHNTIDKSVMAAANNIGRYEYKGVKYAELGENPASSAPLHPKFADKLMAELDKKGIPYQAKCAERTTISVAAENKQSFDAVKKDLTAKLNGKDKSQQEQSQTQGTHSKSRA